MSSSPKYVKFGEWKCDFCTNYSNPDLNVCHICNRVRGNVKSIKNNRDNNCTSKCCICLNNCANVAPVNCGHLAMCDGCYSPDTIRKCPICRDDIDLVVSIIHC